MGFVSEVYGGNAGAGNIGSPSSPSFVVNYDRETNQTAHVNSYGKLLIAEQKRLIGQNNITNPASGQALFTNTAGGSGTNTATNGVSVLATGTTSNSSIDVKTSAKARFQFGRCNLFRAVNRFATAGTANNVREFGIYVDANNAMGFRLNGSTFSVFYKRAGSETVVTSGSFNGNGTAIAGTWAVDSNFHAFEIEYFQARVVWKIDDEAIHTWLANQSTTNIMSSLVGQGYFNNTNSNGSTTNVELHNIGFGIFQHGTGVNNPQFVQLNSGSSATTVLKSGGGTLQTVAITRAAGANSTLTLYDNTAASGTQIAAFDLSNAAGTGTYTFGIDGVNFTNGLTAAVSGTLTNLSATITWE